MEEYFVKVSGRLFEGDLVGKAMARSRERIKRQVDAATDEEMLEADADAWAEGFAAEEAIDPPVVDIAKSTLKSLGRVKVNCTNAPGISYSSSEYGHVIRDGFEFELRVPVSGHATMLNTSIPGVARLPAQLSGDDIVCRWDWPEEKGTAAFEREVESFKNELSRGVEGLRVKIEKANRQIPGFVIEAIEARRSEILAERDFLGELSIRSFAMTRSPRPSTRRRRSSGWRPRRAGSAPLTPILPSASYSPSWTSSTTTSSASSVRSAVALSARRGPSRTPTRKPCGTRCWSP